MCKLEGVYKCSDCGDTYRLWIEHCTDILPEVRPRRKSAQIPVVNEFVWDPLEGCKGLILSINIVVQSARCMVCIQNSTYTFLRRPVGGGSSTGLAQRGPYRSGPDRFIDTPPDMPSSGPNTSIPPSNNRGTAPQNQVIIENIDDSDYDGDGDFMMDDGDSSNVAVASMIVEEAPETTEQNTTATQETVPETSEEERTMELLLAQILALARRQSNLSLPGRA